MPSVEPITSLDQFRQIIGSDESSDDSVAVIDFWATWCGPCKMISPIFEKLAAADQSGKVRYYKVDVDEVGDVAQECGISAMPTFTVFKKGIPVDSMKGAIPAQLTSMITKYQS